jgi:hypothetical protein
VTGGDVIDAVLSERHLTERDQQRAARYWREILEWVKPDHEWMPISPLERAEILAELETQARINRALIAALLEAHARRPAHFRLVAEGER